MMVRFVATPNFLRQNVPVFFIETPESRTPLRASIPVQTEQAFVEDQAQAARVGVYGLLSALLAREPSAETLQVLRDIGEVDTADGKIAMGWELMKQAALKTDIDAVHDEYFSLFIGIGRGELMPFGSWYLTGFLMEKPVAVLRRDLDGLGIERQAGVSESEDHIASLCDAMAILIQHSDEIPLARQIAFYQDHIEPWAGRFFDDLQSASNAHFFRAVGFFGASFIEFESDLLARTS